ncbi:DUF6787 family protein [Flavobacterium davisii]|uniref:Diacylglyceryl transferase n=1 Tax=Flavobacterium columnare TaxID=996 RepID=A0A8G0KXD4_9FLAO|nr:DUF6787 family protein [Flavobacterium davisii]QYS88955.1 diacylglyceryl transferase [Flavobacterium davisii]
MNRLKKHWGIKSNYQLAVIFLVFAINGSLSARISAYFMQFLGLTKESMHWSIYYFLLLILVLPLYPFMLMFFGWLFGQSHFFSPFSKKMLKSMGLGFIFKER